MAISTYSDLQNLVASRLHRTDLTTEIQDAIRLAESEMQVDCKLLEFESTATITVTSGTGSLPANFVGMRSIYWDDDSDHVLTYITPDVFDSARSSTGGDPYEYTISGSTLRVTEGATGSAVATYYAKFTALSDANTSNALLSNHPDAYLYGTLKHMALHTRDMELLQLAGTLFNACKDRITSNNMDRKYAGPLQARVR